MSFMPEKRLAEATTEPAKRCKQIEIPEDFVPMDSTDEGEAARDDNNVSSREVDCYEEEDSDDDGPIEMYTRHLSFYNPDSEKVSRCYCFYCEEETDHPPRFWFCPNAPPEYYSNGVYYCWVCEKETDHVTFYCPHRCHLCLKKPHNDDNHYEQISSHCADCDATEDGWCDLHSF